MATIRDVARISGVSISTVSLALNETGRVSADTYQRIWAAAQAVGYAPNPVAQSLKSGRGRLIGMLVGDISNPLLAQIALGAEVALREAGYAMLLTNSLNDAHLDATHIKLFQQRRVDGLLLSVADETNQDTIAALGRTSKPCVLIDRELDLPEPASAVLCDHLTGIAQAVEHLVALGHRRIALLAGSPHVRPTRVRIAAVEEAAAAHRGLLCQVRSGAFTETHGAAATRELLDSRRPPTALIAGGNQILVGVLRELAARSLRIPADISVVTCDDVPLAEFLSPALATIRRDPYAMGATAARLLVTHLDGGDPQTVTLPATFSPAGSCARPRAEARRQT